MHKSKNQDLTHSHIEMTKCQKCFSTKFMNQKYCDNNCNKINAPYGTCKKLLTKTKIIKYIIGVETVSIKTTKLIQSGDTKTDSIRASTESIFS